MFYKAIKSNTLKTYKPIKRGLGLMDIVLGLLLAGGAYQTYMESAQRTQDSVVADSISSTMKDIQAVGQEWIKDNSAAAMQAMSDNQIIAVPITGNEGPIVGTSALYATGNVPESYSANLPNAQKMAYLIRKVPATVDVPAHLESIITSYGGLAYTNRLLAMTSERIGVTGGAVMEPYYKQRFSVPGKIQGTYGSWSYPQGVWNASGGGGIDYTPRSGHLVMIGTRFGGTVTEFLNRYATGNPESNRMHTSIDMNNNNLLTVNTVNGFAASNLNIGTGSNNNVVMPSNLTVCDYTKTNCGVQIASTSLTNPGDGWTTLSTSSQGLYVNGSEGPNLRSQSGVFTGKTQGNENVSPSGVIFNANSQTGIGAHLFQASPQFLTLSGTNGFTGLDIEPTGSTGDLRMLSTRLFADRSGNLTVELPNGAGVLATQHIDGTMSAFAANALNLGTSQGAAADGGIYPAYMTTGSSGNVSGGPCAPNGRIAASSDGTGKFMACINGHWYSPATQGFNNLIWAGGAYGYTYNNTDSTQLVIVTYDADVRAYTQFNPDFSVWVNGNQVCHNTHDDTNDDQWASYACTVILPPHQSIGVGGTMSWAYRTCRHHMYCWHSGYANPTAYVYSSF